MSLKRPQEHTVAEQGGTITWPLCNLLSSSLGILSKNLTHVNISLKTIVKKAERPNVEIPKFPLNGTSTCTSQERQIWWLLLTVMETSILKCWNSWKCLGRRDTYWVLLCLLLSERQAAFFSFSLAQPPVNKSQWALLLVTLPGLTLCRVHTEQCFLSAHSLDMLRPAGRALRFWPVVNPTKQQPWLSHTQHFSSVWRMTWWAKDK